MVIRQSQYQMTRSPDHPMMWLARRLRNSAGAEIAEAALVMPVVFVFLLGIIWFGRAFNIYSTITQAAQQGAITAARPTCAACGDSFPANSAVSTVVESVMSASSLEPSLIVQNSPQPQLQSCPSPPFPPPPSTPCSQTGNIWICSSVLLASSGQLGGVSQPPCGTVVSFQYPFQFYLPFTSLNLSQVILTAQAESRMEY